MEKNCLCVAVVVVGVIWKLRLTLRPGNYIYRFSYGFGVVVKDLGEWRPGFYSEFRCASHEHSGLPWGAIFETKMIEIKKYTLFENGDVLKFQKCQFSKNKSPCWSFPPRLYLFRIYLQGEKSTKMRYGDFDFA